jgi:hypothetical protein
MKNKYIRLPVIFITLLILSCASSIRSSLHPRTEKTNYKWEQVLPFGSGNFPEKWNKGKFPMGLFPVTGFGGNLWMIWQKAAWSSPDGLNWTYNSKMDWDERISSGFAFFRDKLWMFGGMEYQHNIFLNDTWSSTDGYNWLPGGNAQWPPRKGQSVVVFKNRLWLFGGANEVTKGRISTKFLNDIWSSADGVHWQQEVKAAPWLPREYPRVLVFKDALYLAGGDGYADIWRSGDGKEWASLTPEAEWKKRYAYGAQIFDDKMWVFGGWPEKPTDCLNDVWYSTDGSKWYNQTQKAPWTPRTALHSTVFKDRLWIYSGKHTGAPDSWGGDVWTMGVVSKVKSER